MAGTDTRIADPALLMRVKTRQLVLLAQLGAQRNLGRAAADMAAVMPASLAAHYARLGVLQVLPLELPLQVPSIHLTTRRNRVLSPAAADFERQIAGAQL